MAIKPENSIHSAWVNANDQSDTFFFLTQTGKSKISNSKCMMWTHEVFHAFIHRKDWQRIDPSGKLLLRP